MMEAPVQKHFLYDTLLLKVERLGWLLAVLGLGLYCAIGPKGRVVLTVGLLNLAVVYFLGAFAPVANAVAAPQYAYSDSDSAQGKSFLVDRLLPKVQGQAMAVALVGALFKVCFFPGSAPLLQVGVLTLAATVVVQLAVGTLFRQAAIVMLLGVATWATPVETLVRQVYRNNPALVEKLLYSLQHPKDRAAAAEARRLQRAQGR